MRIRVKPFNRPPFETSLIKFAIDEAIEADEILEIVTTLINGLDYVRAGAAAPIAIERVDTRPLRGPGVE